MTIEVETFPLLEKTENGEYQFDLTYTSTSTIRVTVLETENFQQGMVLTEGTDYKILRTSSIRGGTVKILDQAAITQRYLDEYELDFKLLFIERRIDVSQPIPMADGYSRETTDRALDRLAMISQQLASDLDGLMSVEGIYDPQGAINEPNERGRFPKIDNDDGKNQFQGGNIIQNATTGAIEFRNAGSALVNTLAEVGTFQKVEANELKLSNVSFTATGTKAKRFNLDADQKDKVVVVNSTNDITYSPYTIEDPSDTI